MIDGEFFNALDAEQDDLLAAALEYEEWLEAVHALTPDPEQHDDRHAFPTNS